MKKHVVAPDADDKNDELEFGPILVRDVPFSVREIEVATIVLDRNRTSAIVHGGLKGLLGLSGDEADVLIGILKKIC